MSDIKYNNPDTIPLTVDNGESVSYQIDTESFKNYLYTKPAFHIDFNNIEDILVYINGKTIKLDKNKLQEILLKIGGEVIENV